MSKQQFKKGFIQSRYVKTESGREQVKELVQVIFIGGKKVLVRKSPNVVAWCLESRKK